MTLSPRETTFVLPFYLKLMRANATWVGYEVWEDLVLVGRTATVDDAIWLRSGQWRSIVMGAWLSLRFTRDEVGPAVLDALLQSGGSLTASPLAVAAVILVGDEASTVLRQSQARSEEVSGDVLDAALEWMMADPVHNVSEESRTAFAELVAFGERLRAALVDP